MSWKLKVENGAIMEAPIYEPHRRGKNWCAIIHNDPRGPGGIGRRFLEKARGDYLYMLGDLKRGDAIEFGADYSSTSGKRSPKRWYGIVIEVNQNNIIIEKNEAARDAINDAAALPPLEPPEPSPSPVDLVASWRGELISLLMRAPQEAGDLARKLNDVLNEDASKRFHSA